LLDLVLVIEKKGVALINGILASHHVVEPLEVRKIIHHIEEVELLIVPQQMTP
jgi:hypothetical protein